MLRATEGVTRPFLGGRRALNAIWSGLNNNVDISLLFTTTTRK